MSGVRKLARGALWPVRRLLDPRFADLQRRIDWTRDRVIDETHQLEDRQTELSSLLNTFGAASNESLAFLGRQIREFEGAISDLTVRLEAVESIMGPVFHSRRMQAVADSGVEQLDADTAGC